jgi:RNA polymerase-binding transcription factor DksA
MAAQDRRRAGCSDTFGKGRSVADRGDIEDPDRLRADLLAARAEAVAQRDARTADFEEFVDGADLVNTDDEHDPEGATIAFERAQVIALRDDAVRRIGLIDDALARMDAGTYGRCVGCGRQIPPARLAAIPGVETCVDCAARGISAPPDR